MPCHDDISADLQTHDKTTYEALSTDTLQKEEHSDGDQLAPYVLKARPKSNMHMNIDNNRNSRI